MQRQGGVNLPAVHLPRCGTAGPRGPTFMYLVGVAEVRPSYSEFVRLARDATLVPVSKSVTADLLTPVSAFLAVAGGQPEAFLLESVERGEAVGRYTFPRATP